MTPFDLLVRVSIVLTIAWLLAALLRRRQAALRHWVLAAGLVCAAVTPLAATLAPAWHLPSRSAAGGPAVPQPTTASGAVTVDAVAIAVTARPLAPATPVRPRIDAARVVLWIWIAGAAAALLTLAVGLTRLRWIRRHAEPLADARWTEVSDEVARAYGLSRGATLLQADLPLLVTWGARRPTILVPRGAADWPRDRIRIVLAHELAHVARRDWLTQLTAEIVRALHWCNPLAWIVCRRARLESEHACDDAVLNLGIQGADYASHLLDLARTMHTRRNSWVPAQAIVRPSSLERRVTAMLNARINHAPVSGAGRAAAAVVLALVTVLAAGFSAAQGSTTLSGTITDQLGRVVASAPVSLLDLTTNAVHEVKADDQGRYELTGLAAGDYMLKVAALGFQKVEQRVVLGDSPLQRNIQLQLGMIQETITVTDAPPSNLPPPVTREQAQRIAKARLFPDCGDAGGCIAPPTKIADKKPVFPDTYAGPGEVVVLNGLIDATGHVTNLRAVGQPNPDLAQAAITAVTQWEFEPTRLDGQVVDTTITVTINFRSTR